MTCIIIEDQPPAQRILKKYIEDLGTLQLKATFSDAIQAIDFLKTEDIDLIFLDIHLPKISGMDFLKTISSPPHIILTTAFSEYALESYEFSVVDYLLKPFSFQRFVKAVSKVPVHSASSLHNSDNQKSEYRKELFIKSGYEHLKIDVDDIFYIKSDADYTEIFVPTRKHLASESLRYWMENLDPDKFVRVHKSFIVNATKIKKVSGNQIYLENAVTIPIGRAYKEGFVKKFILE